MGHKDSNFRWWTGAILSVGGWALGCGGGQVVEPTVPSTGNEMVFQFALSGVGDRFAIEGTPSDPNYSASYPNPDKLTSMLVEVFADGTQSSSCGDKACRDTPFSVAMNEEGDLQVWDLHDRLVAEMKAKAKAKAKVKPDRPSPSGSTNGQPGTATPGTATPGTATPGTPGTATPGTPGTATPGTPGTANGASANGESVSVATRGRDGVATPGQPGQGGRGGTATSTGGDAVSVSVQGQNGGTARGEDGGTATSHHSNVNGASNQSADESSSP